jgi:hypothetical protein
MTLNRLSRLPNVILPGLATLAGPLLWAGCARIEAPDLPAVVRVPTPGPGPAYTTTQTDLYTTTTPAGVSRPIEYPTVGESVAAYPPAVTYYETQPAYPAYRTTYQAAYVPAGPASGDEYLLLNSPDKDRREDAAERLGKHGGPGAIPALRQAAAYDPDDDVRKEAAKSLRRIDKRYYGRY